MQPKNCNIQECTARLRRGNGNSPLNQSSVEALQLSACRQPLSSCCTTLSSQMSIVTNSRVTTKDFLVRNARFISMRQ